MSLGRPRHTTEAMMPRTAKILHERMIVDKRRPLPYLLRDLLCWSRSFGGECLEEGVQTTMQAVDVWEEGW